MENQHWPRVVIEEELSRMKNTQMKLNFKWMDKWDINM